MDLQRTLIIVALAIVSYLMVLQWQEDYAKPPVALQQEQAPTDYPQNYPQPAMADRQSGSVPQASAPQADVPQADVPQADVPQAVADIPDVSAPSRPADTAQAQSRWLKVKTDVVEYDIDLRGGDIVGTRLLDYAVAVEMPDSAFPLLTQSPGHTYIAQSGLTGPNGVDVAKSGRPVYQVEQSSYQMTSDAEQLQVDLLLDQASGVRVTKRFTFTRGSYQVRVEYLIQNNSADPWRAALYAQIKRDRSKDPGLSDSIGFGLPTFLGAAYWQSDKPYNKIDFDDMDSSNLNVQAQGGWLAFIQHYFINAWIPNAEQTHQYRTWKVAGPMGDQHYIIGLTSPVITVAAGAEHTIAADFYSGPKILRNLESLTDNKGLDLAVDYGPLFFISKPLFQLLEIYRSLTGNWGIAIILLTLTIKAVFFWLSAKSYRSMANMRRVQPKLVRLKEMYGDDRQRMSQEMMKLYKEEKINPLGGCLPILIQMPVFLALYWALLESVELRQAPFFLWIQDLSVMDPYFLLPLLMGASMWVQQSLNPAPPDPMQAKIMKWMPVIFTVFFLWFPAGLVLYWVTNNVLSIAQQWYITRKVENEGKA